jgi:polyadenylate-binding protein
MTRSPWQERQSKIDEMKAQFTNLYIKNLDPEVSQDEFEALFLQFGHVTSAIIQLDDEGKSKGFGFVNYEHHEEAQAAVDALHDQEHHGRKLFVSRAQKKAEREEELRKSYEHAKIEKLSKYQGVNLYIKNLEDDVDDDKLRAEFEPYGAITSCKVMRDEKGSSKGFGFVCFSSPDEATKAVAEMNNKMIGTKPLYVSLAQRREIRRQQLESQIAQRNQIRMQQAAAAGIPGGYINGPMYYPPGPGAFSPQGRPMMPYPPQGMMPPRPRYPPGGAQVGVGPPIASPYGMPQGYGAMPGYPAARVPPAPRPVGRIPGSPPNPNVPMPRASVPPQANGVPRAAVPPAGVPQARPPPVTVSSRAPPPQQQGYQLNPQTRNVGQAMPAPQVVVPEGPILTAATLKSMPASEAKQMLGEVIYMKVAPYVFFLLPFDLGD